MFEEFLSQNIKATYLDDNKFKIARGYLKEINNNFLKINGKLGVIIINKKNIQKIAKHKK